MPNLYVLIGVPGSGKSTWVQTQEWATGCACINTDKFVEDHAKTVGKTYSEVFHEFMPRAVQLMVAEVNAARDRNQDIIWDQTSTTRHSRNKKFLMLPDYRKIAVLFETPAEDELQRRLNSRPGKIVPWTVVSGMIDSFERPTLAEGFNQIWFVNN